MLIRSWLIMFFCTSLRASSFAFQGKWQRIGTVLFLRFSVSWHFKYRRVLWVFDLTGNATIFSAIVGQRHGEGQNVSCDLGEGERTNECALQCQFWRSQKVGLVWSVPISSIGNHRAWTNRGGESVSLMGRFKKTFLGGVLWHVFPSPELSTPCGAP